MQKIFIYIFGTGLYFYAGTILTSFGFNSYFGIPSSFIEVSLRDNIIYFFQLATGVINSVGFWTWLFLAVLVLVVWAMCLFSHFFRSMFIVFFVVLLFASMFSFYKFGDKLAMSATSFRTIPDDCIEAEDGVQYIIPTFFGTNAVLVAIEKETNKLMGTFLVKETTQLECEIELKEVGEVKK